MANNHETLTALFTDIADAIREKTGGTEPIVADTFPTRISGIVSTGEDLYPTASRQTTSVDTLLREVKRKIADHKGEGEYVWKKYEYFSEKITPLENPTLVVAATNSYKTFTLDLSALPVMPSDVNEFLDGFSIYDGNNVNRGTFSYSDEQLYLDTTAITTTLSGTSLTFNHSFSTWIGSTGSLVYEGVKNIIQRNIIGDFLDYIVSSDPEAYPDGGEQDGFWYERVSEETDLASLILSVTGLTEIAIDNIVMSSTESMTSGSTKKITLNHSLNKTPKLAILMSKIPISNANLGSYLLEFVMASCATNNAASGLGVLLARVGTNTENSLRGNCNVTLGTNTIAINGPDSNKIYMYIGDEYLLITAC